MTPRKPKQTLVSMYLGVGKKFEKAFNYWRDRVCGGKHLINNLLSQMLLK